MNARVLVAFLTLLATAAKAEEAQQSSAQAIPAPEPRSWGWSTVVNSASSAWAAVPSRADVSGAVSGGGSVVLDGSTRAASAAWNRVPSRADVSDLLTASGTKLRGAGIGATGVAAAYASKGIVYVGQEWQALPNNKRFEDGAIAGAIILPTVVGSFYVCTIGTSHLGPIAPAAGVTCAFGGQIVGERLVRSTFGVLGRKIDEDTLRLSSDASLVIGTLGAAKFVSPRSFASAVREMKRVGPRLLGPAPLVAGPILGAANTPAAATVAPLVSPDASAASVAEPAP